MEINQIFVNRVRELRVNRGASAKVTSELCGLGPNYFHRVEAGKVSTPSGESLAAIAEYFGVSMDYLWGRTDVR